MGRLSTSLITVDPVVVRLETASKKASTKLGTLPERTKGRAAKKEARVHPKVTIKTASRTFRREDSLLILARKRPNNAIIPMANKKPKTASRS
jgi:erythromycin esterase-like protein